MKLDATFRARCRGCGTRFGWRGTLWDMPPCPGCGQALPNEEKRGQRQLEAAAEQDALARLTRGVAHRGVRIAEG